MPTGYGTELPIIDAVADFFLGVPGSKAEEVDEEEVRKQKYEESRYHSLDCKNGCGCNTFCDPPYGEAAAKDLERLLGDSSSNLRSANQGVTPVCQQTTATGGDESPTEPWWKFW